MSIDDSHYPTPPPTGMRALRPVTATERAFVALGPAAEAYLRGAAAGGASRLPRTLDDVLGLVRSHGPENVVAALGRATAFATRTRRNSSGRHRWVLELPDAPLVAFRADALVEVPQRRRLPAPRGSLSPH